MKKIILLYLSILISTNNYKAQIVIDIDPTFTTGISANGDITKTVLQPDGKIIVYGTFTTYNNLPYNNFVRLNTDGSIDPTFNCGSSFAPQTYNYSIIAITLQPDGKLLLGGNFTSFNGVACKNIVRLNTNGSVDMSFNASFNSFIYSIKLQSTGKIIVGGYFTNYNLTDSCKNIARLNSNGGFDNSFITGSGFNFMPATSNSILCDILVLNNDEIIAVGSFNIYNSKPTKGIAKLKVNGTLDTTFTYNNGFNYIAYKVLVQPDNKIVCYGDFTSYKGSSISSKSIRIKPNGDINSSYIFTNLLYTNSLKDIIIKPDGNFIFSANIYPSFNVNRISVINSTGSIDSLNFKTGVGFATYTVNSISLQSDGKIIVAGNFISYRGVTCNKIVRLKEVSVVGLKENYLSTNIKIFPNPFLNELTFESINSNSTDKKKIIITNMLGQRVNTTEFYQNNLTIDLLQLQSGAYLAELYLNNQFNFRTKLIKQ